MYEKANITRKLVKKPTCALSSEKKKERTDVKSRKIQIQSV